MGRSKRYLWLAVLAGLTLLVGGGAVVTSQETKGDRQTGQAQAGAPIRLDRSKTDVIEQPVKNIVANGSAPVAPQPPAPAPAARPLDASKTLRIEPPVKNLVANGSAPVSPQPPAPAPAARPLDMTKSVRIEPPVKDLVVTASAPMPPAPPRIPAASDRFVNPKVQPGKVRWHATLADACAAASKSKKPVLLFQMMGKLDDQFC